MLQKFIERPRVEGVHGTGIHARRALALIETVMAEVAFPHPEVIPGRELGDPVWAGLPAPAAGAFADAFIPIHKDDSILPAFKDRRRRAHLGAERGPAVEARERKEGNF